jgi:hypothetical protein
MSQVRQYGKETVDSGDFMEAVFRARSHPDNSTIFWPGVLFPFSIDF